MCKMKQRERLGNINSNILLVTLISVNIEGKHQSISKSDATFFHHLFTHDARNHLPRLRKLASTTYPSLALTALLVCINYTVTPPEYSVVPLAEYEKYQPPTNGPSNTEARNEALIERARDNPGKFTIIQSKVANGQGLQMVLTVVTGSFWKNDPEGFVDGEEGVAVEDEDMSAEGGNVENEFSESRTDEVDVMVARMAFSGLQWVLGRMGLPGLAN